MPNPTWLPYKAEWDNQFSYPVVSDSFVTRWTASQQTSLSITNSRTCSNLCPSSWWCHPTISSSVVPFSSCLQSYPTSGSFPMNHFFASPWPMFEASALSSVLPVNIQDWFPLGLTGLISLQSNNATLHFLLLQRGTDSGENWWFSVWFWFFTLFSDAWTYTP